MNIQTDNSENALITAIRANMSGMFRHISSSSPNENSGHDRFTRWQTALQHPWFSGVLSSDIPSEEDETFVRETIQYFKDKGVGTFTWWLDPHLRAEDWEPVLSKYGFGFSQDTPGMAVDLKDLKSSPTVAGLEIRAVQDEDALHTWVDVFTPGYGLPIEWKHVIFETWRRLGLDLPIRNYIGYLHGKPVSTSCLFLGGGVAGIYSVATLTEARGKGIGAALTLQPLLEAREMGYRIGTLQSSDMGYNIYKNLGFHHLCQIECFYLSPA